MNLLLASRVADYLSKAAANAPSLPPVSEGSVVNVDKHPHGFEGRLLRAPAVSAKLKKTEGPRAYAPRL